MEPIDPQEKIPEDGSSMDVTAWLSTLVRGWWVILAFVVLGALVGAAFTYLSPKQYSASSAVYIGQTTDANGNPMAGLTSNTRAATQLLSSDEVLSEAAERTGMGATASSLRKGTLVDTPTSTIKTSTSIVNIVVITVTDSDPERAAAAANALADVLLERVSGGVDEKITVLEKQLAVGQTAFDESVTRSRAAQAALRALARQNGGRADPSAAAPYLAVVQAAATEQQALQATNQKSELLLLTTRQVEQPRILYEAKVPSEPSGPDVALNAAAGALAGFVVGIIMVFVRRRLSAPS